MDKLVIEGGVKLSGEVTISGAKNAALPIIVAALVLDEPSVISNMPDLQDIRFLIQVIEHLGAKVEYRESTMKIDPRGFELNEVPYELIRKMRGSIYVLGALLARHGRAKVSLPGGCAIGLRPIDIHLKGMEALGANIRIEHGYIEAVTDGGLKGADCFLKGKNGPSVGATCNVLMAAIRAQGTTVIYGAAIEPEITDLVEFLQKSGAQIAGKGTNTLEIQGVSNLKGVSHSVIPDRIETGTFMVAAAITGGDITMVNTRPDHLLTEINKLLEMGLDIQTGENWIRVQKNSERLNSVNLKTMAFPGFATDLQAQFMALLCLADGESTVQETIFPERFIHVAELNRMGARINTMHATSVIQGVSNLSGAHVMASDLRASAALVLAALAAEGVTEVHRIYHLDRGYEKVEAKFAKLGAKISRVSEAGL